MEHNDMADPDGVKKSTDQTSIQARIADKVRSLEELAAIAERARKDGRQVVVTHGVFDLLHVGHLRHLQLARQEGDLLFVTITADKFVNKGPGRPVFGDAIRAEMLAALEFVDWVGINFAPGAQPVIDAIRPNVYVKGSDYENADDDVAGGITLERQAVESHGGRIAFTDDITFSSSALINRHMNVYDPPLRKTLKEVSEGGGLKRLKGLIQGVSDYRVVLVGDTIIDEYRYVRPLGKSAKENMIACKVLNSEIFSGGVLAAANHIANFCSHVEVITCLGQNDPHEDMIRANLAANVTLSAVYRDGKPTTKKTRFVDRAYKRKLFEIYDFDDTPINGGNEARLKELITERCDGADLVIVTDFGHGLITSDLIDCLCDNAAFLAVNAQTNAANRGFNPITRYPRADLICIDEPEARIAVHDNHTDIAAIASTILPKAIDCRKIMVSTGRSGCITYDCNSDRLHRIPAFTKRVIDTVGAGDAFFVLSAPIVRAGGSLEDAGFIGNAAGAMKVEIVGHRKAVGKVPMLKFLDAILK